MVTRMENIQPIKTSRQPSPSTLRIGKRYRPSRVDDSYDAIVIGSGISGGIAAKELCEKGFKIQSTASCLKARIVVSSRLIMSSLVCVG